MTTTEQQTNPREPATTPESESTLPHLLFFHSPRDGGSRRAEGFLAQVLQRRKNHETFRLLRIDADKRSDLVERFRVDKIPTLLVVSDGRVHCRLAQPRGARAIRDVLTPWLK